MTFYGLNGAAIEDDRDLRRSARMVAGDGAVPGPRRAAILERGDLEGQGPRSVGTLEVGTPKCTCLGIWVRECQDIGVLDVKVRRPRTEMNL